MKPKVLLAVPYHERKRYCLGQLYDSLAAIAEYNRISQKLDLEIVVRHDLNVFGQKDNVKKQREFFRLLALSSGADYLFFHGADTIPPEDVLQRLMDHGKQVVSGIYFQRGQKKAMNAITWINTMPVEQKNEMMAFSDPGDRLRKVDGFGLDCALIARPILKNVSFMQWDVNDDDYPFCDAVKALGHDLFVDRTVQCHHWETGVDYSFRGEHFTISG